MRRRREPDHVAQARSGVRDTETLKRLWDELVPEWDGRTFYDFVATSQCFSELPFRYREMFGMVG